MSRPERPAVPRAGEVIRVDSAAIDALVQEALRAPRRRARLSAHPSDGDPLHEMFVALRRGNYLRPHKHRAKSESLHIVRGRCDVVLQDEAGGIVGVVRLGGVRSGLPFYYRLSAPYYHTTLIRSRVLVINETTNGPFRREDSIFPSWAPDEGDPRAVGEFLRALEASVARFLAPKGETASGLSQGARG